MSGLSALKRSALAVAMGSVVGLGGFAASNTSLASTAPVEKPAATSNEGKSPSRYF